MKSGAKCALMPAMPKRPLADAERATRLGGNQPSIVSLRDEARSELLTHQSKLHARHQTISAAKRCLASGDYSLGAKLCKDVEGPGNTVVGLMQDAELNRRMVDLAVERGRKAMKAGHWEQALDALDEAKRLQPMHAELAELLGQVTQTITKQVRAAFAQGRLDQAEMLLDRLRRHEPIQFEVQELSQVLTQCREAATASRTADLASAIECLKTLKRVIPEARWIADAVKDAETAARSIENLRIGPLGSLARRTNQIATATIVGPRPRSIPPMPIHESAGIIPASFQIHLDGAGSFLVVLGAHVTIGTQSRSQPVDVPLLGQIGLPKMAIERLDDDYFLSSDESVVVNGKKTSHTLLASQDQIRLGRRGNMHFTLPNSASTSATLDFAGIRLANGNARRVILMDDALVIGPQRTAHIQSLSMERAMVIHLSNGQLRIRPMSRTMDTPGSIIALDHPHDLDGLSLVVTSVTGVV